MGDGPRHLPDFYYEEGHPINSEKQLQVVGGDIQSRSFLGLDPAGIHMPLHATGPQSLSMCRGALCMSINTDRLSGNIGCQHTKGPDTHTNV